MKIALQALALLAGSLLVFGCARFSGGIAPSSVPIAPGSYSAIGPTEGQDCVYQLLGLLPISGSNHTSAALAAAMEKHPNTAALINVTSDTFSQHYIVFSRSCIRVEGIAVSQP